MITNFNDNYYLTAVKLRGLPEVSTNLHFHYGNADYQAFSGVYRGVGWFGRKIIAIPAAAFSSVILTIYHVTLAVLGAVFASEKGKYIVKQMFSVARDFQAAFGRITSLFNDQFGLFHIEESDFQKTAYQVCFSERNDRRKHYFPPRDIREYTREDVERVYPLGYPERNQTKAKLALLDCDSFKVLLPKLRGDDYYELIPDCHLNNLNFSEITWDQLLKLLPRDSSDSKAKMALLNEENFKLLLPKLEDDPPRFKEIPDCHLNNLNFNAITSCQLSGLLPYCDSGNKTKLAMLTEQNFKLLLPKLDDDHYEAIPDCYLNELDFINITKRQVSSLLPRNDNENKGKLKMLTDHNFKLLLPRLSCYSNIPNKHINNVDYDVITGSQLSDLFPTSIDKFEKTKVKFSLLSPESVFKILSQVSLFNYKNIRLEELISPQQLLDPQVKAKVNEFSDYIQQSSAGNELPI